MAPIFFWGCLRDNKEDNEKKRKQDEKRLEIQCIKTLNHWFLLLISRVYVRKMESYFFLIIFFLVLTIFFLTIGSAPNLFLPLVPCAIKKNKTISPPMNGIKLNKR